MLNSNNAAGGGNDAQAVAAYFLGLSAPPGTCQRCGGHDFQYAWRQFANGTHHISTRCDSCRKFCGWAPQTPGAVALANAALAADYNAVKGLE